MDVSEVYKRASFECACVPATAQMRVQQRELVINLWISKHLSFRVVHAQLSHLVISSALVTGTGNELMPRVREIR